MKRSEIWWISLGSEIRKTRPAIIVSDNSLGKLPLRVVVPITDWKPRYDQAAWMIKLLPNDLNRLSKPSAADCFQVRSVSARRISNQPGTVDEKTMAAIETALAIVLKIKGGVD